MMRELTKSAVIPTKLALALALATALACILSFPQLAFAVVKVDDTELAQGENAVGGGMATLNNSTLAMAGVSAGVLYTDQDLTMNFNGGNDIENVNVGGSAQVEMNFCGENQVEDIYALDNSNVTVNADGHNEFEEVTADNKSNVTINVTGENEFEEIMGFEDANITVRGTDCQKKDTIKLGDDEDVTSLMVTRGSLVIDHVTVDLQGEEAIVGSEQGDVTIDTSKIAKDGDNTFTEILAGGAMLIRESVIDIAGVVHSDGLMTIQHSDVKVKPAAAKNVDASPFRVYSKTGIKLIDEKNGEVKKGEMSDGTVWYVDTDDNDGKDVDLEADGKPAYYTCKGDKEALLRAMPKTGDKTNPLWPIGAGLLSAVTAAFVLRRREEA